MISKESANYGAANGSRKCADCSMYVSGGRCTYVKGAISPNGWCKYWAARSGASAKKAAKGAK